MDVRTQRLAVVGMGRSGTSFLAAFLEAAGVWFDAEHVPSKKGRFRKVEHPGAREIDDEILKTLFAAEQSPPYGNLPESEIELGEPWSGKAAAFVEYMDQASRDAGVTGYWGVKDPRMTLLHSIWVDKLDVLVGIFRDPLDVVESYLAQNWIPGDDKRATALAFWTRFNRSLLAIEQLYPGKRFYLVDFEADMPAQLGNLCDALGLPRDPAAFALYTKSERRGSALLRPLRRARLSPEAKQTYDRLRARRNLL
jgi:hypothetical protein